MQQFLELFHPNPGNAYLLVTTRVDEIADALFSKINAVEGKFGIALYGEGVFEGAKVEHIDSLSKPFKSQPREYDRVIFYDILTKHTNKELLLKLAYRTLANAAEVIIVEQKDTLDVESTKELLESCEYRAPNHIEDVLDGYDVFVARKMHMWGNGL